MLLTSLTKLSLKNNINLQVTSEEFMVQLNVECVILSFSFSKRIFWFDSGRLFQIALLFLLCLTSANEKQIL